MAAARTPFNVTAEARTSSSTSHHSPWHSPVPYLFGGLAAMLGLIAFALLILACSYWKLSGYLENGSESHERDLEAGGQVEDESSDYNNNHGEKQAVVFQDKILVIMAGEVKPTFLATPITSTSSRSSSFADTNVAKSCSCSEKIEKSAENDTLDDHQEQQTGRLAITAQPQQSTDQTH